MTIQQFTLVNVLISVGLIFRSCSGSNSKEQAGKKQRNAFVKVDGRIRWASENRIYVMPDMHPDLYPVQFSDGAPDWATLTDGQPHQTGVVWSDAYLISSAVQTAFGNFRKNTSASDGIGIQDHYANLWRTIAERYADEPGIYILDPDGDVYQKRISDYF
ncbi:MAG: cellulase family glycosylhydrolase [Bacteroidetes bacterium]|nr:cellulase family glycosylhydrolase [Bacteroidota bacterium]